MKRAVCALSLGAFVALLGCHSHSSDETGVQQTQQTDTASAPAASLSAPMSGLTEADKTALTDEVFRRKNSANLYVEVGTGGTVYHNCNEWVGYAYPPTIVDSRVDGNSGQITVSTQTTWNVQYNGNMQDFASKCGLAIAQQRGTTANVGQTFNIAKWDSGWKVAPN